MIRYFCDRCGGEMTQDCRLHYDDTARPSSEDRSSHYMFNRKHLCEKCMETFKAWMRGGKL